MVKKLFFIACMLVGLATARAQIASFPYYQGFENGLNGWSVIDYDEDALDWAVVDDMNFWMEPARTGDYMAMSTCWDEEGMYFPDNFLVSPAISVPSSGTLNLSFWIKATVADMYVDQYYAVYVSTTGNTADDFLMTQPLVDEIASDIEWEQVSVSLEAFSGQTIYIGIRHYNCFYTAVCLDDIELKIAGSAEVRLPVYQVTATTGTPISVIAHYTGSTDGLLFNWSSQMAAAGNATMNPTDSVLTIIYSAFGTDTVTVTASNASGVATDTMVIRVIDPTPISTFPYYTGFEVGDDTNWTLAGSINNWYIGSATSYTGSRSLYISDTRGITHTYEPAYNCASYAYRQFNLTEGSYMISFDYQVQGHSGSFMRAWIAPASDVPTVDIQPGNIAFGNPLVDISTYNPTGWLPVGEHIYGNDNGVWHNESTDVVISDDGTYMLVFMWRNNEYEFSNMPIAIDNVNITKLICHSVSGLNVDSLASTTSILMWSDTMNSSATYTVYNMADTSVVATGITNTFYHLTGLNPFTQYTFGVSADCSSTLHSPIHTFTFTTRCTPDTLPWNENFNSATTTYLPWYNPCWRLYSGYTNWIYLDNSYNHDAAATGKSLRVIGNYTYPSLVILPPFEIPTSQLMVTFWMTSSDLNTCLEWGYISNPDNADLFVPMFQIYPDEINTWEEKLVVYDVPAEGEVAFRYHGDGNGIIHIDDITVQQRPSCERPTSLSISNILFDQSTLHIHGNDADNTYTVVVYNNDSVVTTITTPDTSIILSNLRYNTAYTVSVTPICDDELSYPPLYTSFRTECTVISSDDLPWKEGFEDYSGIVTNANRAIPCMWFIGNGSPYNFRIATDQARVHGGGKSLQFYPNDYHGQRLVAVLPEFEDDISTLRLDFWGQYEATFASPIDTLEVGYLTDITDTNTFVVTSRCVGITDSTQHYYATFFDAPSSARMALRYIPANNICYWWIDDINVDLIPECLAPAASFYEIDSTSVTIDIVDTLNSNVVNYTVAIYADDSILVDSLVLNGFGLHQITNLTGNTRYTFYLRTQCTYYTSDSIILQCRTLCQKVATPYMNGFEIDNVGEVPLCFSHLATPYMSLSNIQNACYVTNNGGHNGGKCMAFEGSSVNVVALPETRENLSNLMLSFWHKTASNMNNGVLQVGYLTDIIDTTTFVPVATYHQYSDNLYHEEEVVFTYAPAGAVAAFRHISSTTNNFGQYINSWLIDDISFYSSFCLRPQNFTVEYVSDTLAMVHINDTNQNLGHYYTLTSTNTGDTIEESIVNTDDFTITGLTPNTSYTISIASICNNMEYSVSLSSTFFTSACAPIPHDQLPWDEKFDTYSIGSLFQPACWRILNRYQSTPQVTTHLYHSSNKSLLVTTNDITKPTTIVLPLFEDAPEDLKLSFWLYTTAANIGIQVGVMGNPSDTSTFIPVITIDSTTTNPLSWQFVQSSFDGIEQGYLAIRYHSSSNGTIYLDDIMVDSNSFCMRPSAIIADNIYDTYVDLSIMADDANSFLITYTDGITDNSITLTNRNYVTLTNLTPNTVYTVTAQSICSDGSLSGAFTYTFRSDCQPISDLPWTDDFSSSLTGQYEDIPCWQILTGTIVNGWGANNYYIYPNWGNPYPGVIMTAEINGIQFEGNRKSFLILPNIEANVSQMTIALDAWYDNTVAENKQFLEVGYMPNISDGTSFIPIDTFLCVTSPYTLWVRDTIFIGEYNLNSPRLALRYSIYVTNGQGSIDIDNVTIDGIITPIVDSSRCAVPAFASPEVGEDSLTCYWHNDGGEYELVLLVDTIENETPIITSDTSYTFYNLLPNTTYTVKIRRHCSAAFFSTWTQQSATTLLHPCYTPEDVEVNDVTLSSVNISWTPAEETQTQFQVIVVNGYIVDTHLVAATHLHVDNLYPNIAYQVSVRAVCDEDYYSDWTTPVDFSTPNCDYPTDVRISDITNTTAKVSWNGNADKYELLYGIEVVAGSGTTLLIENGTMATLTDLIRDTIYDIYLRTVCDEGVYSEWTEKLQFRTTNVGINNVDPNRTSVHPNPASTFIQVTGLQPSSVVSIIDLNGRECGRWMASDERMAIDVSNITRGVYFVRISDSEHSTVHKLVLN